MTQDTLDRSKRVLAALIREYIATGEPVASSLLVSAAGLGVSSATVRNILARLEDEGYVQQPHTSAGRIPTDRGYRFYVDLLLESKRSTRTANAVEARLRRERTGPLADSVLSQASHVVSQASRLVGFALPPAQGSAVFDRVEFIPLGSNRVLVVIVARGSQVLQKVIEISETAERRRAARGGQLPERRIRRPAAHRGRARPSSTASTRNDPLYDALFARAMRLATSTFDEPGGRTAVIVEGTASLLDDGQGVTLEHAAGAGADDRGKAAAGAAAERVHRRPGSDRGDRRRAPDPTLRSFSLIASTYDDAAGTGHDHRRHRAHAHALLARHRRRRRRRAGGVALLRDPN